MVDGWIKQYTTDRDAGLRKIMQFFITATGCKGIVSSQILSSLECAKEIIRLTEECEVVIYSFHLNSINY
jgi:cohesin complex subunit SA-1/2